MNRLWAGEYFFKPIAWEQALYWYGIDIHNASNSKPSLLEEEGSDVLNKQASARPYVVRAAGDLQYGKLERGFGPDAVIALEECIAAIHLTRRVRSCRCK